jgi:hypothetical protein
LAAGERDAEEVMGRAVVFDIERATADWLGDLRRSGSFQESDLEGLRHRLEDETAQLMHHGLSAREAFLVGRSRVVPGYPLPEHQVKAGARGLWRGRFLWIGAGILAYLAFDSIVGLLSYGGSVLAVNAGLEWNSLLIANLLLQTLLTFGAFLFMLHVLPRTKRFGIASGYQRMRQSRTGTVVLYVISIALAVVLSLVSLDGLLFDWGAPRLGWDFMNAVSETMAARFFLSVPFAIALVSIVFVLGRRQKREIHARVER